MLRTLLFVPTTNFELLNMHKQEHGVSLYTRKVLIQARCKQLLPDWLRFVKGARQRLFVRSAGRDSLFRDPSRTTAQASSTRRTSR